MFNLFVPSPTPAATLRIGQLSELTGRSIHALRCGAYTNEAVRIVAVEGRGRVTTKTGKPYNNNYCFVFRLQDGKLRELT